MSDLRIVLWSAVMLVCVLSSESTLRAQTLNWTKATKFDTGVDPSVAVNENGRILEFHQGAHTASVHYTFGQISGNDVEWGTTQRLESGDGTFNYYPSVAVTKDNWVIVVTSDGLSKRSSDLRYWLGFFYPTNGIHQEIQWRVKGRRFDSGYHGSVAVARDGTIAEVHESGSNGKGLYYRVGHIRLVDNELQIVWSSGDKGVYYDDGINPSISINDKGDVVEMHQVTGENKLHYIRGRLTPGSLNLSKTNSVRYLSNDHSPAVALTNSQLAVEAHTRTAYARSAAGYLNADGVTIDWNPGPTFTSTLGYRPALATNSDWLVTEFEDESKNLFYSLARVP